MKSFGISVEWDKLALFAFIFIAVLFDLYLRAALLTLLLGIAGFFWAAYVILRMLLRHSGWRAACLKAVLPVVVFSSLPATILLGLGCQEIALSRAQEIRLTILEKFQGKDLYKAYAEICGNKKCGILSYEIIPIKSDGFGADGILLVMLFNERRASVDIKSGRVTIPEIAY